MNDSEIIKKLQEENARLRVEVTLLKSSNTILKAELDLANETLGGFVTLYEDNQETNRRAEETIHRN